MLERLLAEIRSGGTFETGILADRMGTTSEMVEAMLEHLLRAGFIQSYQGCGDVCGGCNLCGGWVQKQAEDSAEKTLILFTNVTRTT